MTILFGHPSGGPFSHNAALAHFEAGWLEAFCVPWMPSLATLDMLERIPGLAPMAARLRRRNFLPLADAPLIQDRIPEMGRLLLRAVGGGSEALSYQANDSLMRIMARECRRPAVTAVHSYEDCSLWQFSEAKRLGKACIYDMPIGYYPAWEQTQADLARRYADWLPADGLASSRYVRPDQKRREMEMADIVMVPSNFVAQTIAAYEPNKKTALAPYGVESAFWSLTPKRPSRDIITFLFAGQCSLRKGIPLLLEAWKAAGLSSAKLKIVGQWQLADDRLKNLPRHVEWVAPVSKDRLREYYADADVFVFPTYFEGRALVVSEALSAGLPVITTPASGTDDLIDDDCGRLIPAGNLEALVGCLRWFDKNRERIPAMSQAAKLHASRSTWENYRHRVVEAVAPYT